ncbi:hypothetical protein CYY_007947 [Polysphondylium violaceum]|uniref:Major facilitator superfamily (MFS) profile domain-containing protein n=1 Tax=Polysphondylium violaceum TaxID=133409 RepID=A0A8J4PPI2_9MYCE|nr:hypothetical protein CYY_007947 [Polysphondylium violaceum]
MIDTDESMIQENGATFTPYTKDEENVSSEHYTDDDEHSLWIKNKDYLDQEDEDEFDDQYDNINSVKAATSIGRPKYFKDIILVFCLWSVMVMSAFIFSLFIPTMYSQYANYKHPNNTPQENQAIATHMKSITDASPLLMVFVFGPLIGVLSDKYGRKKIFMLNLTLLAIDVTCALISYKSENLVLFFIGHTVCGLTGANSAVVLSFISDLTTKEERPRVFAISGIALGTGIVIGPLMGGFAMKISTSAPLYLVYILVIIGFILLFFMKESTLLRSEEDKLKAKSAKKTINPFKSIIKLFGSSKYVAFVTCLYIVFSFTVEDVLTTMYYYTALRYGWGPVENSYNIAFLGAMVIIYSVFLLPMAIRRFSDRIVISISFLVSAIIRVVYAFAVNQYIWIACGFIGGMGSVILNLTQAIISKSTPPEIQGSILTGVVSVGSLANLAGALVTQNIYAYFISPKAPIYFPGAHFLIDSVPTFLTFIGSLLIWKFYPDTTPTTTKQ